ncbi:MAG: hypothetical protein OXI81_02805 [Paracoccaceae bacterium]|nr:hypothetical protein [Paracoccaceae bacterium]MDE2914880.1 hypothetical protein [Paracoccaceae bacterium]
MLRLIRYLFYLALLMMLGLVGYAYLGDISVPKRQIEQTLETPTY